MSSNKKKRSPEPHASRWRYFERFMFGAVLVFLTVVWLTSTDGPLLAKLADLENWVTATQFYINASAIYVVLREQEELKRIAIWLVELWRDHVIAKGGRKRDVDQNSAEPQNDGQQQPPPPTQPEDLSTNNRVERTTASHRENTSKSDNANGCAIAIVGLVIVAIIAFNIARAVFPRTDDHTDQKNLPPISSDPSISHEWWPLPDLKQESPTPAEEPRQSTENIEATESPTITLARRPNELCYDLARRCTGDGNNWLELVPLNDDLYIDEKTCYVLPGDTSITAPAYWGKKCFEN